MNVFANGTNDCLELSNDRLIAHDINTPHLDNCYIIDNNNNSALSVTVGFIDGLQGTLDVKKTSSIYWKFDKYSERI